MNIEEAFKAFPKKCEAKGMTVKEIDLNKLKNRKSEFETNWKNNLEYLIPEKLKVPFDAAWNISLDLLDKAISS